MPHLRALVERLKDEPFALIGVNTGESEEAYRKGVEDYGVSWTCAWQGPRVSPISDLFRVRVSDSRPRAASVAVEHRGRWFWLADADASSRRTFYLAAALLRLELAGASVSHGPLLTLPVN